MHGTALYLLREDMVSGAWGYSASDFLQEHGAVRMYYEPCDILGGELWGMISLAYYEAPSEIMKGQELDLVAWLCGRGRKCPPYLSYRYPFNKGLQNPEWSIK